ncbi:hypothetical protein IJ596_02365 [bacterium]|nr:hypothetical protein [bacterium]
MVESTEQNLKILEQNRERVHEVIEKSETSRQTNPIARKLLDFSFANKTRKFSVRDLFKR